MKSPFIDRKVDLNSPLNCSSSNVVYCLQCDKNNCLQIYIGKTERTLKERFGEHKTSVRTHAKNAVGDHVNRSGHSVANMKILAIEKVRNRNTNNWKRFATFPVDDFLHLFWQYYNATVLQYNRAAHYSCTTPENPPKNCSFNFAWFKSFQETMSP